MMSIDKKKAYIIVFSTIALFCLFGLIWALYVTRDIRSNIGAVMNGSQMVIVRDLVLTETKDNIKYWELYAKTGSYDGSSKVVTLTDVLGNVYDDNKEVILSFEATKGSYDEETKALILDGKNLIISKTGASITSDKIEWGGKGTDIKASGNVVLKNSEDMITNSDSATFNSDLTYVQIDGNTQVQLYSSTEDTKSNSSLINTK